MSSLYTVLVTTLAIAMSGCIAYLLLILLAAAKGTWCLKRMAGGPSLESSTPLQPPDRMIVIIPAHDEALVIADTLNSLKAQDYPRHLFEIVVVADNCTDSTASLARAHGAIVLERANKVERGKGYALNWALSKLLAQDDTADAFVIVDADTWVASNFLGVMAHQLSIRRDKQNCCALQGRYGVLNWQDGWRSTLMAGALDLVNHIRPLGSDTLGLSFTLKGNGMAFTRAVLERAQWQGHSVTEDIDYGLDLLLEHGIRVGYVADACVRAQMPITATQAVSQRERWEGGRYRLLRERGVPLLMQGLRRRDIRLCDAAFNLALPPLAELAGLLALWGGLILLGSLTHLLRDAGWFSLLLALSIAGFVTYVIGGLRLAGAPRKVYIALLKAPLYAVWKFALYASHGLWRLMRKQNREQEWVRTERIPTLISENGEQSNTPFSAE